MAKDKKQAKEKVKKYDVYMVPVSSIPAFLRWTRARSRRASARPTA